MPVEVFGGEGEVSCFDDLDVAEALEALALASLRRTRLFFATTNISRSKLSPRDGSRNRISIRRLRASDPRWASKRAVALRVLRVLIRGSPSARQGSGTQPTSQAPVSPSSSNTLFVDALLTCMQSYHKRHGLAGILIDGRWGQQLLPNVFAPLRRRLREHLISSYVHIKSGFTRSKTNVVRLAIDLSR